jgi:hypothetical protein
MDTGVAYNLDTLVKPFVEIGGIISLKTNTIDSRILRMKGVLLLTTDSFRQKKQNFECNTPEWNLLTPEWNKCHLLLIISASKTAITTGNIWIYALMVRQLTSPLTMKKL